MTNVAVTGDYFSVLSSAEEAHPSLFLQALSLALLSGFAWSAFSPLPYETHSNTCSCLNPDSESSQAIPRTSSLLNFGLYIYSFGFLFLYFICHCYVLEQRKSIRTWTCFFTKMGSLLQGRPPPSVLSPLPVQFLSFLSEPSVFGFLFGTLPAGFCPHHFTHFHKDGQCPPYCSTP